MSARKTAKAGIVALERMYGTCPVVTFSFPVRGVGEAMLITLTLCEWKRIAAEIAEASAAIGA
ncbi:MAG TPA: hypothetical protein VFC53_12125 [Dehalococcoidia bacterium]|jgi:hypothetical protein|nr:hypothetical protein [Dehalococcoidia bacterium]